MIVKKINEKKKKFIFNKNPKKIEQIIFRIYVHNT